MSWQIIEGDCREQLARLDPASVQTCVTSPPYWGLRDYGMDGQLGLERFPGLYVENLRNIFRQVRRVLRDDGTVWLNLGDSYNSGTQFNAQPKQSYAEAAPGKMAGHRPLAPRLKPKDLVGIPWRVAFALQADGWWLRSDIVWSKPNPMPESVTDRPTRAHEYIFLLSKSARYFYDAEAIREPHRTADDRRNRPDYEPSRGRAMGMPDGDVQRIGTNGPSTWPEAGRNRRSVWEVSTQPYSEAHFATFPPKLIEPCILAGAPQDSTVLDPFAGAGTTGVVATRHNRDFIGIELNPTYAEMARNRIRDDGPLFNYQTELPPLQPSKSTRSGATG